MHDTRTALLATSLLAAACAAAWATALARPAPGGPSMDADMAHGMARMQHDMAAAPRTGDADRDFVAMMIPHHRGAIDMARDELRHGRDAGLRALARRIVTDQRAEIATMRRWQDAHGPAHGGDPVR